MAELKRVIEALLFVHARPLGLKEMVELLPEWKRAEIEEAAEELIREYEERGSSLGWRGWQRVISSARGWSTPPGSGG